MDAYSIRKMVPRIVIGVIAINLSIYLCLATADIARIVGDGIGQLMITPFIQGGKFDFTVGDPDAISGALQAIGAGGLLYVAGAGTLAAVVSAAAKNGSQFNGSETMGFILFVIVIPIVLIALAVLVTIVIRQGLLVFLIIVSPIAFALYILPSTEKYFRQWWDLFLRTLLVYPIIAVIFAMSKIMSSIIFNSNQTLVGVLVGTIVMFLPLMLIPFSFKLAGGVLGSVYGATSNAGKRIGDSGFLKGRREYYKQQTGESLTRAKAESYRKANTDANNMNLSATKRRIAGRRARNLMGYRRDILDKEAEMNIRHKEAQARTTGAGDDLMQRAYSADLKTADSQRAAAATGSTGGGATDMWRINDDGQLQVKTAGGKWVERTAAVQAQEKYGAHNTSALQQSMEYEMGKATTQEEVDSIFQGFGSRADSMGLSENEANGVWIGAGFGKQNEQRQYKYHSWSRDPATGRMTASMNGLGLMREIDEKQGSYQSSMQQADTWTTMSKEVIEAKQVLDTAGSTPEQRTTAQETLLRASRVVDSIRTKQPQLRPDGTPVLDAAGNPVYSEYVGSGAAGRVKEEMTNFASIVDSHAGSYVPPSGEAIPPATPPTPQPTRRVEDSVIDRNQNVPPGDERRTGG